MFIFTIYLNMQLYFLKNIFTLPLLHIKSVKPIASSILHPLIYNAVVLFYIPCKCKSMHSYCRYMVIRKFNLDTFVSKAFTYWEAQR